MNDSDHNSPHTRKPKLLDQVRHAIRTKHYTIRTEESYVYTHVINKGGLGIRSPADSLYK